MVPSQSSIIYIELSSSYFNSLCIDWLSNLDLTPLEIIAVFRCQCVTGFFLSNENTVGLATGLLALMLREALGDRE